MKVIMFSESARVHFKLFIGKLLSVSKPVTAIVLAFWNYPCLSKASLVLAVTGLGFSETAHAFRKLFLRSWTVFALRTCSYGFKTVIVSCVLVPSESVVAFSNCSRFSDSSRPKKQPSKVSRSVYCCVRFSSSIWAGVILSGFVLFSPDTEHWFGALLRHSRSSVMPFMGFFYRQTAACWLLSYQRLRDFLSTSWICISSFLIHLHEYAFHVLKSTSMNMHFKLLFWPWLRLGSADAENHVKYEVINVSAGGAMMGAYCIRTRTIHAKGDLGRWVISQFCVMLLSSPQLKGTKQLRRFLCTSRYFWLQQDGVKGYSCQEQQQPLRTDVIFLVQPVDTAILLLLVFSAKLSCTFIHVLFFNFILFYLLMGPLRRRTGEE